MANGLRIVFTFFKELSRKSRRKRDRRRKKKRRKWKKRRRK